MSREHRVIGPPGTGKTHYLSGQAERAADKYGPQAVVCASLTKAAAQVLARRVESIPRENVGTLHALAYRGLDRPELAETPDGLAEWNLHIEGQAPGLQIGRGAAVDPENAPAEGPVQATEGERLLSELATRRARAEPPDRWPAALRHFAELWTAFKRESRRLDFTDLIERGIHELEACPGGPAVMLLDESQDLSTLEFRLARQWASRTEQTVVCGDPDQNLYAWRGADPDAFWSGEAASEHVLGRSRRVPRAVQEYALRWIGRIEGRRPVEYEPRREDPDDLDSPIVEGEIRSFDAAFVRPGPLLAQLHRDVDEGRTSMVLATCGYMLEPLIRELRDHGIPFHNPYRPSHGGWNPLRGAQRILAFMRPSIEVWDADHRFWTWRDLEQWTEPLDAKLALERGAKSLIQAKCAPNLLGETQPADEIAKAQLVADLIREDGRDRAFDLDLDWWAESLRGSQERRYRYPLAVAGRHGPRALRDRPTLTIGTIHSVKGGEADRVYVFPDLSRTANTQGSPYFGASHDAIVRQFYVAFTRARERLTILEPSGGDYPRALERPAGGPMATKGRRLAAAVKSELLGDPSGQAATIEPGRQPAKEVDGDD